MRPGDLVHLHYVGFQEEMFVFVTPDGDYNFLWFVPIAALLGTGFLFLRRARAFKKQEMLSSYQLNLGYGTFFLFYIGTSRSS